MKARSYMAMRTGPPRSGRRLALVWFALTAFALQSFVTQTHIHFAQNSAGIVFDAKAMNSGKQANAPAQPRDNYPAKEDPANCPICQEIMHAGQYVMPVAVGLALPVQSVSVATLELAAPEFLSTASHSWQGRAPPRL